MGGVPGRVGHLERPPRHLEPFTALQHPQPVARHRQELAPQPIHVLPVEARRARKQLGGIGQMRSAALVNEDLDVRMRLDERPDRARVIEMDVREQDLPHVVQPHARRGQVAASRLGRLVVGPGSISAAPPGPCSTAVAMMFG